jgi:hypothetical protein
MERLNIHVNDGPIIFAAILRAFAGMLSMPVDIKPTMYRHWV